MDDSSVIDFCEKCGVGVWGEKMFKTIKESMEKARDSGDLHQGSVSDSAHGSRDSRSMSSRKVF